MEIKYVDKKFFFDLIKDARSKKHPTDYALMNIVTFTCMFPELRKELNYQDEIVIIDGVKVQLSLYCKQEIIYLSHKKFNIQAAEAQFKYNQANNSF